MAPNHRFSQGAGGWRVDEIVSTNQNLSNVTFGEIILLLVAGMAGGAVNAIAGGGTLLLFPAMLFAGVPPVIANASCTVAVFPGAVASVVAYRRNFKAVRKWLKLFLPIGIIGGLTGSFLLTQTPEALFASLVPWLVLLATLLFMGNGLVRRILQGADSSLGTAPTPGRAWLVGAGLFQLVVGIYGGYFGAGIGILMLASYAILGLGDIHQMNTLKALVSALINCVAAIYFIFALPIAWKETGVLAAGIIVGGYGGAALAQRTPQKVVRAAISIIGLSLAAWFFLRPPSA